MSLDCIHCEKSIAVYCGKCVDAEREELNRLRRLVPTGTYTLNVAHEEEIQRLKDAGEVLIRSLERMTKERDEALRLAYIGEHYFEDLSWKAQHGLLFEDLAKMREALRAAEKRELEALAELDEARAVLQRVVEYDRDPSASWSDLMSWCRGALMDKKEREARCRYLVLP